jgi:hypothetical protein
VFFALELYDVVCKNKNLDFVTEKYFLMFFEKCPKKI